MKNLSITFHVFFVYSVRGINRYKCKVILAFHLSRRSQTDVILNLNKFFWIVFWCVIWSWYGLVFIRSPGADEGPQF
jgi:hypothetical protein